ncbi:hypothetical protein G9A89_019091 [Geosiphon pyriformis]|nr:hypothetical protein G9A89_019091 [Geosiphon pyriformis]
MGTTSGETDYRGDNSDVHGRFGGYGVASPRGFDDRNNDIRSVRVYKKDFDHDWDSDWMPDVDFYELEEAFFVNVNLPGLKKDEIHIDVNSKNELFITGTRLFPKKLIYLDRRITEREYGSIRRRIGLPTDLDPEKIKAKYEEGVLNIEIIYQSDNQSYLEFSVCNMEKDFQYEISRLMEVMEVISVLSIDFYCLDPIYRGWVDMGF